ncbi:peptide ABC transporter substrate-binding protein [Planococcus shenhongbingii]|uniref:Peptide ABC transporter substrate-binding protein n=1 Tax=Planococcus shenhongbingii TaxID=3058398 RepID=A0ABT8N948_9BACL|nr:peptide ABC transporter substrate-binding protein [Planococcus sp. N017]MDN7244406.1 peptide ABC transporter substrate-binding protein [Planococcus sp. N017]
MKRFWLAVLLVLTGIVLGSCNEEGGSDSTVPEGNTETEESAEGNAEEMDAEQVLNLSEGAEIPTMDSALAEDSVAFTILNNVNEGLYRLNQENMAEPAMAEGEPKISDDGLTYTFKLRNANWSDGTPVTAQDFVYAWQRAVDPATGSPYGPYMMAGTIKNAAAIAEGKMNKAELGVEAADDKTLVVTLERPVPYFLSLMSFGTFLPQKEAFITEKGGAYASNSENILYNGPFMLTNWDGTGLTWTMEKNPEYWDAETVKLQTINVDVIKETSTGVNLYTSGQLDRVPLTGEFAMQYAEDPEIIKELAPHIFYFKYNQERNGEKTPLANLNIRKAISMAFNKQDLVDVVMANGSLPANYLVPAEFTFDENKKDFREVNGEMNEFNIEEAKELWATGLEEEGISTIAFELLLDDADISKNTGAYIKAQLEKNLEGITVNVRSVPFSVRLELDASQSYDLQLSGWGPDYQDPMTFIDLFVTDSDQNKMAYSNPEFDALVESAKNELAQDPAARWEAMAQAERILIEEDAAIGPVFQEGIMSLQKPYVIDVVRHPFGGDFGFKWAYISGKE